MVVVAARRLAGPHTRGAAAVQFLPIVDDEGRDFFCRQTEALACDGFEAPRQGSTEGRLAGGSCQEVPGRASLSVPSIVTD